MKRFFEDKLKTNLKLYTALLLSFLMLTVGLCNAVYGVLQNNLQNGSFEDPAITSEYQFKNLYDSNEGYRYYWRTSATDDKIELVKMGDKKPHMETDYSIPAYIPDGSRFAEVNKDERASIYQSFNVQGNNQLSWHFNHRARYGSGTYTVEESENKCDTLALIFGKTQSVNPSRDGDGKDQFSKMVDWIKENPPEIKTNRVSDEIILYTPAFDSNGGFAGNLTENFSTVETDEHNQQWNIRLVKSDIKQWYKYSGLYITPEGVENITMALTAYESSHDDYTYGNLIDNFSIQSTSGGGKLISNGSFEDGNSGWKTTDSTGSLEISNNIGKYMYPAKIRRDAYIADGNQFAELNANEVSSLYQYIKTSASTVYKWDLDHRGRMGMDTMALVIGPKQPFDPDKADNNKNNQDQLMQIVDWIKNQPEKNFGIDLQSYRERGCSQKIIVYTSKFAENGGFEEADGGFFSWEKDAAHSQRWNVWIISSPCDRWYSYGDIDENCNYDYTYTVPEGQDESIFAFVSYHSASKSPSVGNMLDSISFERFFNVKCRTTAPDGGGTYIYKYDSQTDEATDFTYDKNYVGQASEGKVIKIVAKEIPTRVFLGANINGTFVSVDNVDLWEHDEANGTYTYYCNNVDRHYDVELVYSASQVLYDVNGGLAYHYDRENMETGNEVSMGTTLPALLTYQSHEAEGHYGWKFDGWSHLSSGKKYKAVHTIAYSPEGLLSITDGVTSEGEISEDKGITMVAQWLYRQGFQPQDYDIATKNYRSSTHGGTVEIIDASSSNYGTDGGKECYLSEGVIVHSRAITKEGHVFAGWYYPDGRLFSANKDISYEVKNRLVQELYARFDPAIDLAIGKIVEGNGGDAERYFEVVLNLTGAKAETTYRVDGLKDGSITVDGRSVTNPIAIRTDSKGAANNIKIYIKHQDTCLIKGLPPDSTFTIKEKDYTAEDYTAEYTGGNALPSGGVEVTINEEPEITVNSVDTAQDITITNSKNILVPAGLKDSPMPWITIVTLGLIILCAMLLLKTKKRSI